METVPTVTGTTIGQPIPVSWPTGSAMVAVDEVVFFFLASFSVLLTGMVKRGCAAGPGAAGFHHVDLSEALGIFMRDFGLGDFEELFGGVAVGERTAGSVRTGADVRITIPLTLAEVEAGVEEGHGQAARHVRALSGHGRGARNARGNVPQLRGGGRGAAGAAVVLGAVPHRRAMPHLQGRWHDHAGAVQEVPW